MHTMLAFTVAHKMHRKRTDNFLAPLELSRLEAEEAEELGGEITQTGDSRGP